MGIIEILFTSEWVSTLFMVICVAICTKIFVLPKEFISNQATRIVLMKRQEERKSVQTTNIYEE